MTKENGTKAYPKEKPEENLELAYAISIHKSQGSEFDRTYVIVPKIAGRSLSPELLYTALTRATAHSTLLVQSNVSTLTNARRRENSQTALINSSLFGKFRTVPELLLRRQEWYAEGKVHEALTRDMVRSKSELVIANLLYSYKIPFLYEMELFANDGSMYLPDFTISWNGETWFWEHLGRLDLEPYRKQWEQKKAWYEKHFPGQLITTQEGATLSRDAESILINKLKAVKAA